MQQLLVVMKSGVNSYLPLWLSLCAVLLGLPAALSFVRFPNVTKDALASSEHPFDDVSFPKCLDGGWPATPDPHPLSLPL